MKTNIGQVEVTPKIILTRKPKPIGARRCSLQQRMIHLDSSESRRIRRVYSRMGSKGISAVSVNFLEGIAAVRRKRYDQAISKCVVAVGVGDIKIQLIALSRRCSLKEEGGRNQMILLTQSRRIIPHFDPSGPSASPAVCP